MATIAAVVSAAAMAASAANNIYQSSKGGSGGGGGGGGGGGIGGSMNQGSSLANDILSGGALVGMKNDIYDYLYGNQSATNAINILNDTPNNYARTQGIFQNTVLPGMTEAANTGFRQDISPIIQQRQNAFWQDYFPQLKESLPGATSTFSTDFLGNMNAEQRRLQTELGVLDYNAGEAAAGRRMSALPTLGNLGITYSGLPSAVARDYMSGINATDPGMRAIDILGKLNQVSGSGQYVQQGYDPAGSQTANMISAGAGGVADIARALGSVNWGGGGGGGSGLSSGQALTNMGGSTGAMSGQSIFGPNYGNLAGSLGYTP